MTLEAKLRALVVELRKDKQGDRATAPAIDPYDAGKLNQSIEDADRIEALLAERQEPPALPERILCMNCGKSVSTPVPLQTIVRAWVECPECIEAKGKVGLAAAAPSSGTGERK